MTYVGLSGGIVAIRRQFRSIVLAEFEGEFREAFVGVPTVKIETHALSEIGGIFVRRRLIESIMADEKADLILTDEVIDAEMLPVQEQNTVMPRKERSSSSCETRLLVAYHSGHIIVPSLDSLSGVANSYSASQSIPSRVRSATWNPS